MRSDVLVIGGGVIGLAIAREAGRRGLRVTVVDRAECGREASWAAAGMLGTQTETEHGGDFFELCRRSAALFPALADELLDETGIDVELDTAGTISVAFSEPELERLADSTKWQREAGLRADIISAADIRRAEPFISTDAAGGVFMPDDGQVDNRRLVEALRASAESAGVSIVENEEIAGLVTSGGAVTGARSGTAVWEADHTVVATGAWTSLIKLGEIGSLPEIKPIRGQIAVYKTAKRLFTHVLHARGGYLVPRRDGRVLIGATAEDVGFDKSSTSAAGEWLRSVAVGTAPGLANLSFSDGWAGLRPGTPDGDPMIGGFGGLEGLTLAVGHYRNGILLAPITAKMVADRILGEYEYPIANAFLPDRFRFRAVNEAR
ncbi:MAG: glycine oxidase ThiO [Acidobacteria bacterium]|nr:glycine oxidase ThiO [Acidobacteriota bacterium]MCW5950267.1 glycine oxidase ThiO [Pyrinomonadaceae bacterium]